VPLLQVIYRSQSTCCSCVILCHHAKTSAIAAAIMSHAKATTATTVFIELSVVFTLCLKLSCCWHHCVCVCVHACMRACMCDECLMSSVNAAMNYNQTPLSSACFVLVRALTLEDCYDSLG